METETKPKQEYVGLETTPDLYINSIRLLITPYDFQFIAGTTAPNNNGDVVTFVKAKIMMSPSHAKVLAGLLAAHVVAYEKHFGPIPDNLRATNSPKMEMIPDPNEEGQK